MAKYLHPQVYEGQLFWRKLEESIKCQVSGVKKEQEKQDLWHAIISTITKHDTLTHDTLTQQFDIPYRVWIVPDSATVVETEDGALVTEAKLKVMLEVEYLAQKTGDRKQNTEETKTTKDLTIDHRQSNIDCSKELMKEIIIPKITQVVNESPKYAQLRQIYHSLILAQWYKVRHGRTNSNESGVMSNEKKTQNSELTTHNSPPITKPSIYEEAINKGYTKGLESEYPWSKQKIWKEYQESYNKGEYTTQVSLIGIGVRKFFSGGIDLTQGWTVSQTSLSDYSSAVTLISPMIYDTPPKFFIIKSEEFSKLPLTLTINSSLLSAQTDTKFQEGLSIAFSSPLEVVRVETSGAIEEKERIFTTVKLSSPNKNTGYNYKKEKRDIIENIISGNSGEAIKAFHNAAQLGYRYAALEAIRNLPSKNMQVIALAIYLFEGAISEDILSYFDIRNKQAEIIKYLSEQKIISYNGLRWQFHPDKTLLSDGAYRSLYAYQDLMFNDKYLSQTDNKLTTEQRRWLDTQFNFRQILVDQIAGQTQFGRFFMDFVGTRPNTYSLFHLSQFENIWSKVEERLNFAKTIISIEEKLNLLADDLDSQQLMKEAISEQRHSTYPERLDVENLQLKNFLMQKGIDPSKSITLDQGCSTMVTTERLQKYLGGIVIGTDLSSFKQIVSRSGGRKTRVDDNYLYVPQLSEKLQFRQSNMANDFFEDLSGRVDLIRHANVLHYLDKKSFFQTVTNVFRYARQNPKGLLYHMVKSDTSRPGLFDQFVFNIKGENLADWKLVYAGYIASATNKEHNPNYSVEEIAGNESVISNKVLVIRQKILSFINPQKCFDKYGQIIPQTHDWLFSSLFHNPPISIEDEFEEMILDDILLISPWRYFNEYTHTYYRDNKIIVPHELYWDFANSFYDLNQLLDALTKRLSQFELELNNP